MSNLPVVLVSSQAKISAVLNAFNTLKDKSYKLPIGVGIIIKDPWYILGFLLIVITKSSS